MPDHACDRRGQHDPVRGLSDIVLLGYSYGGMVVTGALEHIAERVAHLVYLDAFVPDDGHTVATSPGRRRAAAGDRAGRRLAGAADGAASSRTRPRAAWASARRTSHPVGCFTEPVRLARPLEDYPFTRTYIKATGEPRRGPGGPFWAAADRAKASPAWRYREIATDHMIPINRPGELVGLLLELT